MEWHYYNKALKKDQKKEPRLWENGFLLHLDNVPNKHSNFSEAVLGPEEHYSTFKLNYSIILVIY